MGTKPPGAPGDREIRSGADLTVALLAAWKLDDSPAQAHLAHLAAAFDRLALLEAALGGTDGLLVGLAAGRRTVSAKSVEVLLKAERQASETFTAALEALDLDEQPPAVLAAAARFRRAG